MPAQEVFPPAYVEGLSTCMRWKCFPFCLDRRGLPPHAWEVLFPLPGQEGLWSCMFRRCFVLCMCACVRGVFSPSAVGCFASCASGVCFCVCLGRCFLSCTLWGGVCSPGCVCGWWFLTSAHVGVFFASGCVWGQCFPSCTPMDVFLPGCMCGRCFASACSRAASPPHRASVFFSPSVFS